MIQGSCGDNEVRTVVRPHGTLTGGGGLECDSCIEFESNSGTIGNNKDWRAVRQDQR